MIKNKIQYLVIHHSAISYNKNSDQLKAINVYHKAKWGFKSSLGYYIGYHYIINKKGKIIQTRADTDIGAHCYQSNMNYRSLGILCQGHFNIEKPTPQQIYALRDLLRRLVKKYRINKNNIVFHRDYAPTACPGSSMDINFIRSLVSPNVIPEVSKPSINKEIKQKLLDINNQITTLIEKL